MLRRALSARNLLLHVIVSNFVTFNHIPFLSLLFVLYIRASLPRLALFRHRGVNLPSESSSSASRPNRRKSVYLAPKTCRVTRQSDSRKSLKPKSASWVAAMVAMVSDLDGRSGHDQGGSEVVKWWSMREPRRGDADMDSQARVAADRRFDTARWSRDTGDEDGWRWWMKMERVAIVPRPPEQFLLQTACTLVPCHAGSLDIRHAAMAKIWPGALSPVIGAGCRWIR